MGTRIKVHIHGDLRDIVVRRRGEGGKIRQVHAKDVPVKEVSTVLSKIMTDLDAFIPGTAIAP